MCVVDSYDELIVDEILMVLKKVSSFKFIYKLAMNQPASVSNDSPIVDRWLTQSVKLLLKGVPCFEELEELEAWLRVPRLRDQVSICVADVSSIICRTEA